MVRLHHATEKKAKLHGITLEIVENEVTARKGDYHLASHMSGSKALDMALERLAKIPIEEPAPKAIPPRLAKIKAALKDRPKTEDLAFCNSLLGVDENIDFAVQDQEEGPDDLALPDTSGGVVKRTYRDRYKPHGSTCGDDLAAQVAEHIKYEDDAGQTRVDSAKLKALAQLNDCWDAKYANLNNGLARMSVVNRLRAKVRKGHTVKWGTK